MDAHSEMAEGRKDESRYHPPRPKAEGLLGVGEGGGGGLAFVGAHTRQRQLHSGLEEEEEDVFGTGPRSMTQMSARRYNLPKNDAIQAQIMGRLLRFRDGASEDLSEDLSETRPG